ncbi:ER membrane protein complex subunit 8/9-like protein [Zancudomyces culisetae]|uniref:ER membrane protein complex subunit 8/9-like protein n=1 Tax=Zancudomyces culisetae TaxID=1213189 RepID=A0A1R1PDF7_ZANCU|nr:ER membrane protein complex subunit 8/9-like protein [Zancudomyces culisetae]OMH83425.1 ER membrane protein complex subunit 8/9-like protein [Zancudomyces culisetae]|eukprot:OMH78963.1 ER membrane protein complex subunit 8/9-like protein [Zancudomyces culisetae]
MQYSISKLAYSKIIFHALKYSHANIHGVLIGEIKEGSGVVRVIDAVPLGHLMIETSPMAEIALQQIELYAKDTEKKIVGYYAGYNDEKNGLSPSGEIIASKIRSVNKDSVVLILDKSKFRQVDIVPVITPYVQSGAQWRPFNFEQNPDASKKEDQMYFENNTALETVKKLLSVMDKIVICDFDSHLEDLSVDWLQNQHFNNLVKLL